MSGNKRCWFAWAAACLILTGCGETVEESGLLTQDLILPEQVNYSTQEVVEGEYVSTGKGKVVVDYPVSADLYCKVPGARMKETVVLKGQPVAKGDPLMIFEVEQHETEIRELELEISRIRQSLAAQTAQIGAEMNQLRESLGWLSYNDAKLTSLKIRSMEVECEQLANDADRKIRLLEDEIKDYEELVQEGVLVAPCDGYVDYLAFYEVGERISQDEVLVSMHAEDVMFLKSKDTDLLRYQMPVTIHAGNNTSKAELKGHVVSASNILPIGVTQDYVMVTLDETPPEHALKWAISLEFELQRIEQALVVDTRVIRREGEKSFVYLLEDEMVKKRYVRTDFSGPEGVWILDGLTEGQTLILDY